MHYALCTRFLTLLQIRFKEKCLKADFHSVEFSDWTGNPLLMCENVAVNLNRMLRMTKILLSKIQSARKILLSGTRADFVIQ